MKRFLLILLMVMALCVVTLTAGPPVAVNPITMDDSYTALPVAATATTFQPTITQADVALGTLAVLMSGFLLLIYFFYKPLKPSMYLRRLPRHTLHYARDQDSLKPA